MAFLYSSDILFIGWDGRGAFCCCLISMMGLIGCFLRYWLCFCDPRNNKCYLFEMMKSHCGRFVCPIGWKPFLLVTDCTEGAVGGWRRGWERQGSFVSSVLEVASSHRRVGDFLIQKIFLPHFLIITRILVVLEMSNEISVWLSSSVRRKNKICLENSDGLIFYYQKKVLILHRFSHDAEVWWEIKPLLIT